MHQYISKYENLMNTKNNIFWEKKRFCKPLKEIAKKLGAKIIISIWNSGNK